MELFLQQIAAGIATGSIYACTALSLVMIHQAIRHINFAQGEMAMVSTFIAWQLMAWGVSYWLAFLLTIALSFAGGFLVQRLAFGRLQQAPVLSQVVGFIALLTILGSMAGFIWDYSIRPFPTPFGTSPFLGSPLIGAHQAGVIAVTALLLGLLYAFLHLTRAGRAMRAATQDPLAAQLVGVDVATMAALGWGMAAAIGAIAGMLVAPIVFLEPNMMLGILVYGFTAAVLGGLDSPLGAVLGGFLVGILENLTATYVPVIGAELKLPLALFVIVAVLLARPSGLLGGPVVRRV